MSYRVIKEGLVGAGGSDGGVCVGETDGEEKKKRDVIQHRSAAARALGRYSGY